MTTTDRRPIRGRSIRIIRLVIDKGRAFCLLSVGLFTGHCEAFDSKTAVSLNIREARPQPFTVGHISTAIGAALEGR